MMNGVRTGHFSLMETTGEQPGLLDTCLKAPDFRTSPRLASYSQTPHNKPDFFFFYKNVRVIFGYARMDISDFSILVSSSLHRFLTV